MVPSDSDLLRRYVEDHSEAAFAELVGRRIDLVYAAALRQLGGDAARAHDVAQQVFIDLARKARSLWRHPSLVGWLYTSTHHAAVNIIRTESSRKKREEEALAMENLDRSSTQKTDWERVRPLLDAAMHELGERERHLVLLRFFERQDFHAISREMGLTENAAQKRVGRALDKLQAILAKRGVKSTSTALGLALGTEAIVAAPAGLAASVSGTALTAAAASLGATAMGILGFMSTSKIVGIVTVLVVAVGGYATYEAVKVRQREPSPASAVQERVEVRPRNSAPAAAQPAVAALVATESSRPPGPSPHAARDDEKPGNPAVTPESAAQQEKAKLHRRYDPFLLQERGLTPGQADRFVELMLARAQAREDVQAAVRQQGVRGDDPQIVELRRTLDAPIAAELRQLLGEDGYRAYNQYEATSAYRMGFIEPMRPDFASANLPLSSEQEQFLIQVLKANDHPVRVNATDLGLQRRFDWEAIHAQAQTVLSPAQAALFEQHLQRWRSVMK